MPCDGTDIRFHSVFLLSNAHADGVDATRRGYSAQRQNLHFGGGVPMSKDSSSLRTLKPWVRESVQGLVGAETRGTAVP